MVQGNITQSVVAREAIWTYRGQTEDTSEKDFFLALNKLVAGEIMRNVHGGAHIWVGREMQLHVGSYTFQARLTNV